MRLDADASGQMLRMARRMRMEVTMSMLRIVMTTTLALVLGHAVVLAQSDLDRIHHNIKGLVEAHEAGWQCQSDQPMTAPGQSPPFLLENCNLMGTRIIEMGRGIVDIVTSRHVLFSVWVLESEADARQLISRYVDAQDSYNRVQHYEAVNGLGDEAYGYGTDHSNLLLRSGRYVMQVLPGASVQYDPDARTLTQAQKKARDTSERLRLGQLFAKHMLDALKK